MPYASQAQAAYLHIHNPKLAQKWDKEAHQGKDPEMGDQLLNEIFNPSGPTLPAPQPNLTQPSVTLKP